MFCTILRCSAQSFCTILRCSAQSFCTILVCQKGFCSNHLKNAHDTAFSPPKFRLRDFVRNMTHESYSGEAPLNPTSSSEQALTKGGTAAPPPPPPPPGQKNWKYS